MIARPKEVAPVVSHRLPFFRLVVAALLVAVASGGIQAAERVVRFDVPTMGTVATLAVVTADSAETAARVQPALRVFARVDSLMSNWSQASELSRVNREAPRGPVKVEPEVLEVIRAALHAAEASQGAFDPTIEPLVRLWGFLDGTPRRPDPDEIETLLARVGWARVNVDPRAGTVTYDHPDLALDLGGIAKGHAADRAARALRDAGVENALVDLSGNMVSRGNPPGRDSWVVGVRDPDADFDWFASLRLEGDAVATSGSYEQFVAVDGEVYGHVLDPRTGWPSRGLDAVTVLAPDARTADAWATALLAAGPRQARRMAQSRPDLQVILVHSAHQGLREVWVETSLQERFRLVRGQSDRFAVRWF